MPETTKRIKRLVREHAAIAHERELGMALRDLHVQFGRWRNGEISAADLNDAIHRFHDGASREVWRKYSTNRLEAALGFAVATGILRREDLPAELILHLSGFIDFFKAEQSASSPDCLDVHPPGNAMPRLRSEESRSMTLYSPRGFCVGSRESDGQR